MPKAATRVNEPTDQARNALSDLVAPQLNRAWFGTGKDPALSFLLEVESEGSGSDGERKAKNDPIDQEPGVRGVLWLEPGRHNPLQTIQVE